MKNLSWKRKLAGLLAAAGLLSPAAAQAADLNTNLIINPSFENVNQGEAGPFTAVRLLDWIDSDGDDDDTFSYPYSSAYSGAPGPPGAGDWHFTGGFNTAIDQPLVQQEIDVSTGASGALIATGGAAYNLSAYFSSYLTQDDSSSVRASFLNTSGTQIGFAEVGGLDFVQGAIPVSGNQRDWGQDLAVGLVPTGTASVLLQVVSSDADVNHDGYVDLVDFLITDELRLPAIDLEIDRDDGSITLNNRTGDPLHISGYSITSDVSALDPASWLSITDNYDADNDQSVDAVNRWTELTNPNQNTDLSEADLESGTGTTLLNEQSINLSAAGGWIRNPTEDLVFEYVSDGEVVQGLIAFVGNGGQKYVFGDLDLNGSIDVLDWGVFRDGQHTDLSELSPLAAYFQGDLTGDNLNNHTDFIAFQALFDEANGAGAFAAMLEEVPEPSSLILVLTSGLFLCGPLRRSRKLEQADIHDPLEIRHR